MTIQPLKVETKPKQLPALAEDRMAGAVKAITEGKVTIEQIKEKNTLTDEQLKVLQEAELMYNEKNK